MEEHRIQLTRGQFAIVNEADFEQLNQWRWFATWNRYTRSFYAARNSSTGATFAPISEIERY